MTVTASGLFLLTQLARYNATQLAVNLSLTSHKLALFTDAVTPNFSSDTAYGVSPYDANECTTATFWPAGGVALSALAAGGTNVVPTLTESPTGTMKYDFTNDIAVASTTIVDAMCGLLYLDALAGNNALLLIDFVTAANTNAGTFGMTIAAGGVFTVDYTP